VGDGRTKVKLMSGKLEDGVSVSRWVVRRGNYVSGRWTKES
jgi:hypothetical protein